MAAANITATAKVTVLVHKLSMLGAVNTPQTDPGTPYEGVTVSGIIYDEGTNPTEHPPPDQCYYDCFGPYTTGSSGSSSVDTLKMTPVIPGPPPVAGDIRPIFVPTSIASEAPGGFYNGDYFSAGMLLLADSTFGAGYRYGFSFVPFALTISGVASFVSAVGTGGFDAGYTGSNLIAVAGTDYYTFARSEVANWYRTGLSEIGGAGYYIMFDWSFPGYQPPQPAAENVIVDPALPYPMPLPTGFHLHDLNVIIHIVVDDMVTKPTVPAPATAVTIQHYTRAQMALPAGAASPLLYLLSSQSRTTVTRSFTLQTAYGGPANLIPEYSLIPSATAEIVSSDLRASVSKDGGYSWAPAVDVGMICQDGDSLADERVTSLTAGPRMDGGGFIGQSVAWTGTLGNTHLIPQTIVVSPSGRIFVRASTARQFDGSVAGDLTTGLNIGLQDTVAPRVCDLVTLASRDSSGALVSAFRDAATANQTFGSVLHSVAAPASTALYVVSSAGNYQGSRGQGGHSLGPSAYYLLLFDQPGDVGPQYYQRYTSNDGGDTWASDPTWDSTLHIEEFQRDQAVCQYGLVDAQASSNKVYAFDVMVQAPLTSGLARATGLGSGGPGGGGLWDIPADGTSRFGTFGLGATHYAITRGPVNAPTNATQTTIPLSGGLVGGGVFYYNSHLCVINATGGVVTASVSEDCGQTWTDTMSSSDNCKTWSKSS